MTIHSILKLDIINGAIDHSAVPRLAGVYVFYNGTNVQYVGKASNLRKRITFGYFKKNIKDIRIKYIVSCSTHLAIHITASEPDALFLENILIRKLNPAHNIHHRDKDTYPYLCITDHEFPRIAKFSEQDIVGKYGPFLSHNEIDQNIKDIMRAFKLRSCSDYIFKTRREPCMLYHMARCSAPCVGYTSKEQYQEALNAFRECISFDRQAIIKKYSIMMRLYSDRMEYENAAVCRDRLKLIANIRSMQYLYINNINDINLIVQYHDVAISIAQFRDGYISNHEIFFRDFDKNINHFLNAQSKKIQVITNNKILAKKFGFKIPKVSRKHASKNASDIASSDKYVNMIDTAEKHLKNTVDYLSQQNNHRKAVLDELQDISNRYIKNKISRITDIEAFDNSHLMGAVPCAGIILWNVYCGFNKKLHTLIRIPGNNNDDYDMMRYAMQVRIQSNKILPDVIIIDGGIGQVNAVKGMLEDVPIFGIAKNPDRIIDINGMVVQVSRNLMLFIQSLRDEAHYFVKNKHSTIRDANMKLEY